MAWEGLSSLVELCLERGMIIEYRTEESGNLEFGDWRDAVFGGRAATYIPFEKRMYLNEKGLSAYRSYPGHLHELGHAVWSLLLTPQEKWGQYHPLWKAARAQGYLLNDYQKENVQEGWAGDFVAYWCHKKLRAGVWRSQLMHHDLTRYKLIEGIMKRLGMDTEVLYGQFK